MELNSEKIRELLKDDERSIAWLAREINVKPVTMVYRLKHRVVSKDIEKIAKVLGVRPSTLVKFG